MLKKLHQFIKDNKEELKQQGVILHDDHKLPTTRREMLASGLYSAGFTVMMPTVGSLLFNTKAAMADECPALPAPSGVPFFQVHASGGWITRDVIHGLAGNGRDGDYTQPGGGFTANDYYEWGIAAPWHPSVKAPLMIGGHPVPQTSELYFAAQDYFGVSDPNTVLGNKLNIFSFNHRAPDDSASTLQNFLSSVSILRGNGGDFPVASTSEGTQLSGLNALPAFGINAKTNVVRGADISGLVDPGNMPSEARAAYIQSVSKMIKERLKNAEAKKIMGCSADRAVQLVERYSQAFDPSTDFPALSTAIPNNASLKSVMGMLFSGLSCAGGMSIGGCDYHGNGAVSQHNKNFDIYRNTIWPVIDAAIKSNKPLIIAITSDGAVRCSVSETPVTRTVTINGVATDFDFVSPDGIGDFGRNGCTLMFVVGELPAELIKYHQIGYALAGGGVARNGNLIGYDQVASSSAVLETARRAMAALNPANKPKGTFQDATNGTRLASTLEPFIPIKEEA